MPEPNTGITSGDTSTCVANPIYRHHTPGRAHRPESVVRPHTRSGGRRVPVLFDSHNSAVSGGSSEVRRRASPAPGCGRAASLWKLDKLAGRSTTANAPSPRWQKNTFANLGRPTLFGAWVGATGSGCLGDVGAWAATKPDVPVQQKGRHIASSGGVGVVGAAVGLLKRVGSYLAGFGETAGDLPQFQVQLLGGMP